MEKLRLVSYRSVLEISESQGSYFEGFFLNVFDVGRRMLGSCMRRTVISYVIGVRAREFILKVQNCREISTTCHQSTACPLNKSQFIDRNPKEKNRNALLIVFVVCCVVVGLTTFSGFLILLCVLVWQIWLWVYRAHFDIMSKCCLLGKCFFFFFFGMSESKTHT